MDTQSIIAEIGIVDAATVAILEIWREAEDDNPYGFRTFYDFHMDMISSYIVSIREDDHEEIPEMFNEWTENHFLELYDSLLAIYLGKFIVKPKVH